MKANRLSRRLNQKVETENNNSNQVIIEIPEVKIVEKIKKVRRKNKEIVKVVEEMKKADVKVL